MYASTTIQKLIEIKKDISSPDQNVPYSTSLCDPSSATSRHQQVSPQYLSATRKPVYC